MEPCGSRDKSGSPRISALGIKGIVSGDDSCRALGPSFKAQNHLESSGTFLIWMGHCEAGKQVAYESRESMGSSHHLFKDILYHSSCGQWLPMGPDLVEIEGFWIPY